jgi:hypothetical protein
MSQNDLSRGSVILYPFLWLRESARGETEGRKKRETVIVSRFVLDGADHLALLPITASAPTDASTVYELPQTEVRRIARGAKTRLWVALTEINVDSVEESFYLEPGCKVGELSPRVFADVWRAFLAVSSKAKTANRKA